MPRIDFRKLGGEIKKNELSGAYFLYGSEQYLLSKYLERLLKRAAPSMPAFNLQKFETEKGQLDWNAVEDAVQNLPMMSPRKAVVLHDLNPEQLPAEEMKRFQKLVEELPDTTVLAVYVSGFDLPVKTNRKVQNFLKFMEKNGTVVEFAPLSKNDLGKYLVDEAAKAGCFLSAAVADRVVEACGPDLTPLLANLEKLISFTGKGEITAEAVDSLVEKTMDATAFDLANALLRGNLDAAFQAVAELKAQRVEPIMAAGALNSAFVDLYRAKCALAAGKTAADVTADFGYNPRVRFRVDNAFRSAGKTETEALRRAVRLLRQLDLQLKSSKADSYELLEMALVRIQAGKE